MALTTCQDGGRKSWKRGRKWQERVKEGACERKVLSSPDDILTVALHVPWAVSDPLGAEAGFLDHAPGPSQVPGAT